MHNLRQRPLFVSGPKGFSMTTNVSPVQNVTVESTGCTYERPFAANGLAVVRLTIGAMFVWVFVENLGKEPVYVSLRRTNQLLHQGEPLSGRMESRHGNGCKSRRIGRSYAGGHGNLAGNTACSPVQPPLWLLCISAVSGCQSGARRGFVNS